MLQRKLKQRENRGCDINIRHSWIHKKIRKDTQDFIIIEVENFTEMSHKYLWTLELIKQKRKVIHEEKWTKIEKYSEILIYFS